MNQHCAIWSEFCKRNKKGCWVTQQPQLQHTLCSLYHESWVHECVALPQSWPEWYSRYNASVLKMSVCNHMLYTDNFGQSPGSLYRFHSDRRRTIQSRLDQSGSSLAWGIFSPMVGVGVRVHCKLLRVVLCLKMSVPKEATRYNLQKSASH